MSSSLDKARAAVAAAKDLMEKTEIDPHTGSLPLAVDLDISRLISVANVQANITVAAAIEYFVESHVGKIPEPD